MQALCAFSEKVHCPCTLWLGLVHNLSILSLSVHVVSAITNFMAQKFKFQNWSDIYTTCICTFYIHVWLTFIGYTSQVAFYRNSFIKYGPIDYDKNADVLCPLCLIFYYMSTLYRHVPVHTCTLYMYMQALHHCDSMASMYSVYLMHR